MENKISNKKRYGFIDFLKVFSIFLVVFAHFLPSGSFLRIGVYSFHMPIFFVLAGFTYKENRTFTEMFSSVFRRIIIPYMIFFVISFLFDWICGNVNLSTIFDILFVTGKINLSNTVLWFFPCYVLVLFLFMFANKILKNKTYILTFLNIFLTIILFYNNVFYYFGFNKVLLFLIYFSIGYYMNRYNKYISLSLKTCFIIFIFFLLLVIMYSSINIGNNISINENDINNPIVFLLFSILECVSLVICTFNIKVNNNISIISNNTLFIMSTHLFFRILLQKVCSNIHMYITCGILVFFIEVFFIFEIRKIKNRKVRKLLKFIGIVI